MTERKRRKDKNRVRANSCISDIPGSLWEVYTSSVLSDFTDQSQLRKNCLPNGVKSQRRQSGIGLVSDWLATLSAQLNR